MAEDLAVPPRAPHELTNPRTLAKRLACLIGAKHRLTGKTRTDGSNARKSVASVLLNVRLPPAAADGTWKCVPPKRKGVPRILREFVDTYIVTTGNAYNLQVWNRNPAQPSAQIEYSDGSTLNANHVRFVFVRVHPIKHVIRCIVVLTPEYIVERFGTFGKPTVKQQLIVTERARNKVCAMKPPVAFYGDDESVRGLMSNRDDVGRALIHDPPTPGRILTLAAIRKRVVPALLGARIESAATKNRGQALELLVATALDYAVTPHHALIGGYPDIRHQALEVKVQDSPTVDLGRYSPQFDEEVPGCPGFTTETIRYLIALMDAGTATCNGIVLCPGRRLGELFSYVADKSFKCQRSIPMSFFDGLDGRSVFNPPRS